MLLEIYLDVIVVLARESHGQLSFGPGTAFPQPTHVRRELQVLDRDRRGKERGGRLRLAMKGVERRKRVGERKRKKG